MNAQTKITGFPQWNGRRISEEMLGQLWLENFTSRSVKRNKPKPRQKPLRPDTTQERVYNMLPTAPIMTPAYIAERLGLTSKQVRNALRNLQQAGRSNNVSYRNGKVWRTKWGRV